MRITGGRYSGRQVVCPPGVIRPAMDRMRESLFAILGDLHGKSFLDLFSGSGLMALEAASRGASAVTAVEKDPRKRTIILKNIGIAEERIELHMVPVERYLKRTKSRWDYIFLDPPFAYRFKTQLLRWITERSLLGDGGILLIHHPLPELLPQIIARDAADAGDGIERFDRRTYGGSAVDFYRTVRHLVEG